MTMFFNVLYFRSGLPLARSKIKTKVKYFGHHEPLTKHFFLVKLWRTHLHILPPINRRRQRTLKGWLGWEMNCQHCEFLERNKNSPVGFLQVQWNKNRKRVFPENYQRHQTLAFDDYDFYLLEF